MIMMNTTERKDLGEDAEEDVEEVVGVVLLEAKIECTVDSLGMHVLSFSKYISTFGLIYLTLFITGFCKVALFKQCFPTCLTGAFIIFVVRSR